MDWMRFIRRQHAGCCQLQLLEGCVGLSLRFTGEEVDIGKASKGFTQLANLLERFQYGVGGECFLYLGGLCQQCRVVLAAVE